MELPERATPGLHDFLCTRILPRYVRPGGRAVDLGTGSGALAVRLRQMGMDVLAVDIDEKAFRADLPFLRVDLNEPDFARQLGEGMFDLVTAVEVIEHLESPIGFLRNVRRLLKADGIAVLTTPNVENAISRVRFFLKGDFPSMNRYADPTHISPIHWDLLLRQYLPKSGLVLRDHCPYPTNGFIGIPPFYKPLVPFFKIASRFLNSQNILGDNLILILGKIP